MNNTVKELKLDFWGIFQQGWKTFWYKIKDVLLLSLFTYIPFLIVLVLNSVNPTPSDVGINDPKFYLFSILILTHAFFSLTLAVSLAIITEKVVDQKDISWLDAIKEAFSMWGRALVTIILTSLVLFGLFLLFVVPGIIYSTYYAFIIPAIALREKFGKEALSYSKQLVEGQWWRVFGIQLGLSLVLGIIGVVINVSLGLISDNIYLAIISNLITYWLGIVLSIMNVVLFLNNDFVYHRRLAKRKEMEKSRKIKRTSSTEKNIEIPKKVSTELAKRAPTKRVVRKQEEKTAVTKRIARSKK